MLNDSSAEHGVFKKSIHTFVISWFGKHDNAERIVGEVSRASDAVTVIYSDPDSNAPVRFTCPAIRRPNDLFFGDKFQACIDYCDADILLLIHADCNSDNWSKVPEYCRRAVEQNSNIGVWAPLVDFADWSLDRTEIDKIPNSQLSIVAQTDAVVFALTREIVDRMRRADLKANVYGWGTDFMFNYYTYGIGKISVVDRSVLVGHPRGTEYSGEIATSQLEEFLKQLTPAERNQSVLLGRIVELRDRIKEAKVKDSTMVADAERELTLLSRRILEGANPVTRPTLTRVSDGLRSWVVGLRRSRLDRNRRRQ
jgi:hypothetical protein